MTNDPSGEAAAREHWAQIAQAVTAQRATARTTAESDEPPRSAVVDPVETEAVHAIEAPASASAPPTSTAVASEAASGSKRRFFSRPSPDVAAAPAGEGVNPLLPDGAGRRPASRRREDVDELDDDAATGLDVLGLGHVTGPAIPPPAPTPLNPALRLPASWPPRRPTVPGEHLVQVVGLHGGAGTSTMAALIGPAAIDCGAGLDNVVDVTVPVLFVTRSHARGLDLALRIGQQFAARNLDPLPVLGLCVIHDAPSLSKGLARALRSVERSLPNCWTLPWNEDVRHDPALPPAADRGRMARDVRRILRKAGRLRDRDDGEAEQPTHSQSI